MHYPFMDDVTPFIDEREALRAHFIGSDDIITAGFGRAQQGQTDGGTEQGEKDAVMTFDSMQACFELRDGVCVHERRYCNWAIYKSLPPVFVSGGRAWRRAKRWSRCVVIQAAVGARGYNYWCSFVSIRG